MIQALLIACVLFVFFNRDLDSKKSGSFYAADRNEGRPKLLEKYMKNMHYIQTPLWYCIFVPFMIMLFIIFHLLRPETMWINILAAILIPMGTSAACGPLYQGYINVGAGKPFIDPNENRYIDFAIPIIWKRIKIPKFWYGKYRIILAIFGVAEIVTGFLLIF